MDPKKDAGTQCGFHLPGQDCIPLNYEKPVSGKLEDGLTFFDSVAQYLLNKLPESTSRWRM
jgi:hypothetical protein